MEHLNQRYNQAETVMDKDDASVDPEEQDTSTQFLQKQKNRLIDITDHFERFCSGLPASNSTAQDMISF